MRLCLLRTIAVYLSLLLPSTGYAQGGEGAAKPTTALFLTKVTNLDEPTAAAVLELMRSAYQQAANAPVLAEPATTAALGNHGGQALPAAQQLGATQYIELSVIGLDSQISVAATLYQAHDGAVLFSQRMTGASLNDMEAVSDRLARALHQRAATADTATPQTVTALEARSAHRIGDVRRGGLRAGMGTSLLGGELRGAYVTGAVDIRLEGSSHFVEVAIGVILPGRFSSGNYSIGGLTAELGGGLYLLDGPTAPYVALVVSPRIVGGLYSGAGLTVAGKFGLTFARFHDSSLFTEASIGQYLIPADADTGTGEQTARFPTEFNLSAGILW